MSGEQLLSNLFLTFDSKLVYFRLANFLCYVWIMNEHSTIYFIFYVYTIKFGNFIIFAVNAKFLSLSVSLMSTVDTYIIVLVFQSINIAWQKLLLFSYNNPTQS